MNDWESHLASLESTPLLGAIRELFDREASRIEPLEHAIEVYIAGGAAVHFWTRARVTGDVDAEFGARYRPGDDIVLYRTSEGEDKPVYIDRQYNSMFGLLHEGYRQNAYSVGARLGGGTAFHIHVLSPVDLAISKIAWWAEHDQQDVVEMARQGLIDPDELQSKANEALATAVGFNAGMVAVNIREAVDHVRQFRTAPGA